MERDLPKTLNAKSILEDAVTTMHQRGAMYGHPYTNHKRIADLWTAYLGFPIQPDQVAICMALVKVSRLSETWGAKAEDSYTDLVAYSALAGQLSTTDPEEFDAY
jgi:hypothetical protein